MEHDRVSTRIGGFVDQLSRLLEFAIVVRSCPRRSRTSVHRVQQIDLQSRTRPYSKIDCLVNKSFSSSSTVAWAPRGSKHVTWMSQQEFRIIQDILDGPHVQGQRVSVLTIVERIEEARTRTTRGGRKIRPRHRRDLCCASVLPQPSSAV